MVEDASERSYLPLTRLHLARLSDLARADHERYTRLGGRPEYADRLVAVVLAQGAGQHFVDGRNGVKDLDVWRFYAAIPGVAFREGRRETHSDFGPSDLGRQRYRLEDAKNSRARALWQRWQETYLGRRLDHMIRTLPVEPEADTEEALAALQDWLDRGSRRKPRAGQRASSAWYLAQKAVVVIDPIAIRGRHVWPM